MNIFLLSKDPVEAAKMQCDQHVVKMTLESAQMLNTVARIHGNEGAPYRATHVKHPCTLWAAANVRHWWWLQRHALALLNEYAFRYERMHGCHGAITWSLNHPPWSEANEAGEPERFALAMPVGYKRTDPVASYRAYYVGEKARFARWNRGRPPPAWWPTY